MAKEDNRPPDGPCLKEKKKNTKKSALLDR